MHSERLQFVTAADGKYLHYLACHVRSLTVHTSKEHAIDITVINRGISVRAKAELEALVPHPHRLMWFEPTREQLQALQAPLEFATCSPHYFRLLAPFLLPSYSRAIYLDADTVVVGDISPLWTMDLETYPVGAMRDYLECVRHAISNYEELGLDPESHYFNSGVLIMDLDHWRRERVAERVLSVCAQHKDCLRAQGRWPQFDQYGLNVVLNKQWKQLDEMWNHASHVPHSTERVVHFIGNGKVGFPDCQPSFTNLFYDVLCTTPYKDWRPSYLAG